MEFSGIDRRQHERVDINSVVEVVFYDGDLEQTRMKACNISQGGVLLEYWQLFPEDTVLGLDIRLPQIGSRIYGYGKIVRSFEASSGLYRMGIKFVSLDGNGFSDLGRLVNQGRQKV